MNPAVIAARLRNEDGGDFVRELTAHLLRGHVISTPEIFLMGRAVPRDCDPSDLWAEWPPDQCDTWFVWVGIGPIRKLIAAMPYELPWIGFYRQGRGRESNSFVETKRLRRG